jgi:hypothetical protein
MVEDNNGNQLETATVRFKVGKSAVQVTDLTAEPELFNIGHNVNINMVYENNGSVNVSGELKIIIRDEYGMIVEEFSANFTGLPTTASDRLESIWSTAGSNPGIYYITGFVFYDNKIAESPTIAIKDLATGLRVIVEFIQTIGLVKGIENSLISKLENAATAIERGQYKTTMQILQSLINELNAIIGKKITETQAEQIVNKVENVIDNMGG